MYRREWIESSWWRRWQVRLIGLGLGANIVYHGLKWLVEAVCLLVHGGE